MGQLLELSKSLFESDPAPPGTVTTAPIDDPVVPTDDVAVEGTASANDQATTFNILLDSNIDPRQVFKEAPPLAVQKLLNKDALNQIAKWYGATSVYTNPEDRTFLETWTGVSPESVGLPRGGFSEVLRNIFGSAASEDQIKAAKEAADLVIARSSNLSAPSSMRAREEILAGKVPTRAELTGTDAPLRASGERFAPHLEDYIRERGQYNIETPTARAKVIERDYGLISQLPDKETVGQGLRQNLAWGLELPKDSEGRNVALEFVRPMLLKEINAKYRTDSEGNITDPYTAEHLDLKIIDLGPDGKRISFRHPSDPSKQTLLDPVNFEWGDILENMPMLLTPTTEIGSAIVGGAASAFLSGGNPIATFAGTTTAAAVGAFGGRLLTQQISLEKLGYTKDLRKGGYVKKKADGTDALITFESLLFDRMTEAEWSLLGSGLGSVLFKVARGVLTRGASEINTFMPEKKFIEAAEEFSKTQRGIELRAAGISATPSYILDSKADDILRQAEGLNDPAAYARATKLANVYRTAANKLKAREESTEAAAGRRGEIAAFRQRQASEEAGVPPESLSNPELAAQFGNNVANAIERGAIADIHTGLDNLTASNRALIDDFRAMIGGADPVTDAATLAQRLAGTSDEIFGAARGVDKWTTRTGIYGIYNHVRAQAAQKVKGRSLRAFDLMRAHTDFEKAIQRVRNSMGSAFPDQLQAQHSKMINATGGKANYIELDTAINEIDNYIKMAAKEGNANHLPNLNRLKAQYEKIRMEGLNKLDPKLAEMFKAARNAELEVHDIWTQALREGLASGNTDTVFNALIKGSRTPEVVDDLIAGLVAKRPTLVGEKIGEKELVGGAALASTGDLDLLRNLIKVHYKKALGTVDTEAGGGAATTVAGRAQTVVLDDGTAFRAVPVAGSRSSEFIEEYKPWIQALFPDDPNFEKFTDFITRGYSLQREAKRLAKAESELRNQPWIKSGDLRIEEDLASVLRDEPQRIINSALNADSSGEAIKTLKGIFARAYGKGTPEDDLANEQMRALVFRRLLNPSDVTTTAKTTQLNPLESTVETLKVIELYEPAMKATFGAPQTRNIKRFFDEAVNAVKHVPVGIEAAAAAAGKAAPEWLRKTMAGPAGIAAKVYVGVLNKRARALNLGTKWLGEGDLSKFDRLLNDGELLARALRIRKGTTRNKIMVNALASALFITEDRADELLDTYTVTDASGQIQPWAPVATKEQAGRSNIIRELQQGPLNVNIHPPEGKGVLPGVNP
jgi:hypothetical protein